MSIQLEQAVNDALAEGVTVKIWRNKLTISPGDLPAAQRLRRYGYQLVAASRSDGPIRCYACPRRNLCHAQAIARGDIFATCILEEARHAHE